MNVLIKNLYENILNLLYEPQCPFEASNECSASGDKEFLTGCTAGRVCNLCFTQFVDLNLPTRTGIAHIEEVISSAEYKDQPKAIIKKLKWVNPKLAGPIAELIHHKITSTLPFLEFDFIVPVPGLMNEERNCIPSLLLADELSKIYSKPVLNMLVKLEETNLHKHSKLQRQSIVEKAYALQSAESMHKNLAKLGKAKKIILVDDIVTTGLTLSKCASLLKQVMPALEIYAVTYASVSHT